MLENNTLRPGGGKEGGESEQPGEQVISTLFCSASD
jgi:hypothetical protein